MTHRLERYVEAYLRMAKEARYRPKAPGDGTPPRRVSKREATAYALEFDAEEDERRFLIGCSDFDTNRAFVFVIE